jgi:hypothetical protein
MTYLSCPECHLSIHVRFASLTLEHCPRCIARRRTATPLLRSPEPDGPVSDAAGTVGPDEIGFSQVSPKAP